MLTDEGSTPKVNRRLAAILAADIAGYSMLIGIDEEATLRDLKAHQVVVFPMVGEYGGAIINTAGDGILAEFSSVLNAMKCALAIQQVMTERNTSVDPARRMQFRIGVNQGDVVVDDTRAHGVGVLVAVRLQDIAEPGGICISGKVHDEIIGKFDADFEDCGHQSLKNIALPVHVYRRRPSLHGSPALLDKPRMTARQQRRLAAILAADIAGYSTLMGADDEATVRQLKAHQAVVLPMVGEHGGRIIDTAGDGILAEFASVVNAVECALAIQKTMAERNAGTDPERRMLFRIAVNLGDVIHDEQRVYGDGVNIAARLEAIADPGGICLSGEAFAQVQRRLQLSAIDLGNQQLKNIAQPVRAYRVATEPISARQATPRPALTLPDKPSIAVLPFTNLSDDPKEDYFSNGITEDIITELSRFSELFVIARNSSFTYKGRAVDVRQVGRELGVRYLLEGSIRRAGDRVRISGQLVDAGTGAHRWAERYDRRLEDVFAVQDEVTRTVVSTLAAHVRKAESERVRTKPPNSWEAYDYFLQAADALASFNALFNKEDLYKARHLVEQSLAIDPKYARSYAILARTYDAAWIHPFDSDHLNPSALNQAHQLARKAVQLDPNLPLAHACLGVVLTFRHEHDASIAAFERAIALNPNHVDWTFAMALVFAGDSRRAIDVLETYMRLDPFYTPFASGLLGFAHYMLKHYAQALPLLRDYVCQAPTNRLGHALLAATHAKLGQLEKAQAEAAEVLLLQPNYTITGKARRLFAFKRPKDDKNFFDGLRKAGLPE